jgi:peptide/nickel transport system substrate-binding protein
MSRKLRRRAFITTGALALAGAACARRDVAATPAAAPKPAEATPAAAAKPAEAKPAASVPQSGSPEPSKPASAEAKPTAAAPASATTPAPAAAPAKPSGPPKRGGTITALVQNDWVQLDPLFDTGSGNGFDMLFDTWVKWAKDPKTGNWAPTPALIAEWSLSPEQATFKLQKGVKFHDGTPWDAKAAKWNLDRMIFHPQSREKGVFAGVDASKEDPAELEKLKDLNRQTFDFASKAVEVVDELTVRLRLSRPIAPLMAALAGAGISPVSPTAYQKLGKDAFARAPVGAGPFKLVEWRSGDRVVVERNPSYWRMGADEKPLPYLDKIVYRLVIDDAVRLLELKSGNAQFMESVLAKDVPSVKSDPNLVLIESDGQGISRRMAFDGKNPQSPFVKHPELRKAMQHAIDKQAMAKTLGFESGVPDRWNFQKGNFAYDESVPFYSFDKAKAQQIVKDVLAKDPSLAGPDGKIPITLTVISRTVDKTQSEMIKQMAGDVGFNFTIEILERAAYVAKIVQLPSKPGADYHLGTVQNPVTPSDPDSNPRAILHSKGGQNYNHVDVFDDVIDRAASTYELEQRKKAYREFLQKDYDLALMAYMWFQKYNWLHAKKLKNFEEAAGGAWYFADVWLD